MTLEENILENLRKLPADKQMEVLGFIQFLINKITPGGPRRNLKGVLADQNISLTAEDIDEARREMWVGTLVGERS